MKRLSRQAGNGESKTISPKDPAFDQVVDDARKAWLQARHHFDNVTDPDLIDHAIYEIVAAEASTCTCCDLSAKSEARLKPKRSRSRSKQDIDQPGSLKNLPLEAVQLESTGPTA